MSEMNNTGFGARLKSARESLHLSEKEAATRLRLNSRFITMMESEEFEPGLPQTFIKGYFRSYGRLLNLTETEIDNGIFSFHQANSISPSPNVTPLQPTILKRDTHNLDRYLRWASYGIMSLLFVSVITWWASHPRYNEIDTIQTAQTDVPLQPTTPNLAASVASNTTTQLTPPAHQAPTPAATQVASLNPVQPASPTPIAAQPLTPQKPVLASTDSSDTNKATNKPESNADDEGSDNDYDNSDDTY